jgi:murein DD-endopeptidase MepM/ murein hydrolase activator NlpD
MNKSLRRVLAAVMLLVLGAATHAAVPVELRGSAIQGGLIVGQTAPGSVVYQDGDRVRVSPAGRFLLGFHRDAPAASTLVVELPGGMRYERELAVEAREYQIQRIDGLPPRKVTPRSAEDLARIRSDIVAVKRSRALDDPREDWLQGFEWPVEGPISGVYGSQRVLNGEPRRPHYGVDIAVPTGTPVRAPAAGVVTLAVPDMFFSGGTLVLDHGHKLSSSFLHLDRLLVEPGDRVEKGDVIAEVGATGRVTGPHLDWRMNLRDRRIDPQLLVPPMPN